MQSRPKVGGVAPFPPLPGQPYPPSRNHPRWKELYRLHDEWIMKYWPFQSKKKRDRIPVMKLAGFSTWCAPAANFDRMVWGGRIAGIFFLADDYVDSGGMVERIPGFKQAATGSGPLHPEDRAELCHDIVFRAIKATCHPRTFKQLVKCTHEWWDSNIHEPYRELDQYLSGRRVNIAMYFANAYFRYTLDINLTDEQVNHPLMREAEGIVADHVGLTNDYFSYAKERMTDSDHTNIIRILQEHEGFTYKEALKVVEVKILEKEQAFITAGLAVLKDPELGQDPEVQRWIKCLPYCMGGNKAWSQESGRYNVGNVLEGIIFPSLPCEMEETPEGDRIDPVELEDGNYIADIPPPDFSLDVDPIGVSSGSAISVTLTLPTNNRPRPSDVGILALEVLKADQVPDIMAMDLQNDHDILSTSIGPTITALLLKYNIDRLAVGRIDTAVDSISASEKMRSTWKRSISRVFHDSEIILSEPTTDPTAALFAAVSWIESSIWDGRNAIVFSGSVGCCTAAMLIGPNASIVLEHTYGVCSEGIGPIASLSPSVYSLTSLKKAYQSYQTKLATMLIKPAQKAINDLAEADANSWLTCSPFPHLTSREFDYMVYELSGEESSVAHAYINYLDYALNQPLLRQALSDDCDIQEFLGTCFNAPSPTSQDYAKRVAPSKHIIGDVAVGSAFVGVASILASIPAYELFEKRISVFTASPGGMGWFLVLRIKGDTNQFHDILAVKI